MAESRPLTPEQAARTLNRLTGLAKAEAVQILNETAEAIAAGASARAPVRTGRLKSAIAARKTSVKRKRPQAAAGVKRSGGGERRGDVFEGEQQDPYYWKFVEYGTQRTPQVPMFRPAALAEEPKHKHKMITALQKAADDLARDA